MGFSLRLNSGLPAERTISTIAGNLHKSNNAGQTRFEEHVRVSGLQDEISRTNVRLDFQLEESRQAHKVDARRCRYNVANIKLAKKKN